MKAVAYCRKSTSGTDENGIERQEGSFDRQRASIEDYAKKKGIQISKWYEEPVSGKSVRKRKIFKQMGKDAQAGHFRAILFGEYDRFMRNVWEAWRYELILREAGVKIHFSNMSNDGSDSEEMYKDMFRRMAANYSKELARKTVQGMHRKAKMGSWLGGIPPYGYRKEMDAQGNGKLILHPEEAKTVRLMFQLSAKGWGQKRIAIELNRRGIPPSEMAKARNSKAHKNPDGKWPAGSIASILRNPVYCGRYRWNKRARIDCFDWKIEGRGTVEVGNLRSELEEFKKHDSDNSIYVDRSKPEEEWVTKENGVPQIISEQDFKRVQSRFPRLGKWTRGNHTKYLMAGGLKCTTCGNGVFGHRYSKKLISTQQRASYEYYRCSGDVKKGSHGRSASPMIRRDAIDSAVIGGILKRTQRFVDAGKVQELFRNRVREYLEARPNRLIDVEAQIAKIDRKIDRMISMSAEFDREIPKAEIRAMKEKRWKLDEERKTLLAAGDGRAPRDPDKEAEEFLSKVQESIPVLESGDPHDRIRIRDRWLQSAEINWTVTRTRVTLNWWKIPVCDNGEQRRLHHFKIEYAKKKRCRRTSRRADCRSGFHVRRRARMDAVCKPLGFPPALYRFHHDRRRNLAGLYCVFHRARSGLFQGCGTRRDD